MNKGLRTAILGCGKIARKHAEVLASIEDVKLVGFCDQGIENAKSFNETFGPGEVFTDHEVMFKKLDLDMIFICLPPFAHTNEVELACKHGVHFLIEKPIALSMDQADQMAQQVHASGVKSQVGFMYRHGEAVKWLKEYMNEYNKFWCRFYVRPLLLQFTSSLLVAGQNEERWSAC